MNFTDIKNATLRFGKADIAFWLLPPLMALLVAGTLAQRWMGLWPALDVFFGGFILWAGPIPLPGAYTWLSLLSAGVAIKFVLKSRWRWRKAGIHLSHLGVLVLLLGGLLTSITARETYMLIPEGQETPYTYSYTKRSLSIYKGDQEVRKLPYEEIEHWDFAGLPFAVEITQHCANCGILKRAETQDYDEDAAYQGMAEFMALAPKAKLEPQPENNLTGFEFMVSGAPDEAQNGRYIAFDGMPKPIEIGDYTLMFGKAQHALPFTIMLKDFVKDDYAGTSMARGYSSDIVVKDGGVEWPARIEMNKPLRYKGYTFFQSSFEQAPGFEATVLAVVENQGRLFPYIAAGLIGVGLLLHLVLVVYGRKDKEKRTA